ncbi:MAG: DUF4249 family protein [Chlorobi bacterium]|nr:DUF4249 family protein [Chlorobiota bacterium]
MKILKLIIIVAGLFALIACEDTVNPNDEFKEEIALNCVIHGDSSYQIATVLRSFPFGDETSAAESFVDDVQLRLWYDVDEQDDAFLFRDSVITVQDENGNDMKAKFYYINGVNIEPEKAMEIEAILPNGKRLFSSTKTPEKLTLSHDYFIPPEEFGRDYFHLEWYFPEGERVVQPRMKIKYTYNNHGTKEYREIFVPVKLDENNGSAPPVYPSPVLDKEIDFYMNAIDWTMEKISEGDSVKENYSIIGAEVTLLVYDKNLTGYYTSTNTILDDYSIRIDEIDFSNIEGGLGLFGSFIQQKIDVSISSNYIIRYGYLIGK